MPFHTLLGLSRKSGIKHNELLAISSKIDQNYRSFKVDKRTGGKREIFAPKPGLKAIQRTLADEISRRGNVSSCVHGYVIGRSIKSHASSHLGSTSFLKIDIENFFPSITEQKVARVLSDLGFRVDIIPSLVNLCCRNGTLPQGSPASPAISNQCLKEIDRNLEAFASAHDLKYSRYADDIVLSGDTDDHSLLDLAINVVEEGGYQVNVMKSFFANRPKKLVLTGLSLSTGTLKVPKAYKRAVRQEAYRFAAKGTSYLFSDGKFDPFTFDKIMGRLAFWAWVEEEAAFPRRYMQLFSERFAGGRSFPHLPDQTI